MSRRDLGSNFETIGKYLNQESPKKAKPEERPAAVQPEQPFKYSAKFEEAYAKLLSNPEEAVSHLTADVRHVGSTIELSPKKYAELTAALKGPSAETKKVVETGTKRVETTAVQAQTRVENAQTTFMEKVSKASSWWEAGKIVGAHFKENRRKKEEHAARLEQKSYFGAVLKEINSSLAKAAKRKAEIQAELAKIESQLQVDAA